jgi:predicted nucleic acid-binding protein
MRYIVDTSVFIDFFRGKSIPIFENIVLQNQVVLSGFVRLELMIGASKTDGLRLERTLAGLVPLYNEHQSQLLMASEKILKSVRSKGITVGTVDLLIAAQSHLTGYPVFSFDKVFAKIASTKLITVVE